MYVQLSTHSNLGTNITAERVCQTTIGEEPTLGYHYKDLTTVKQYFSYHYGIATGYSSSFSGSHMSTIRSMLNNGNAYILGWKYTDPSTGNSTGHVTICDGYETTSTGGYKYKIMDPDGGRDYSVTVTSGTSIPTNDEFISSKIYVLDRTLSYDYLTK